MALGKSRKSDSRMTSRTITHRYDTLPSRQELLQTLQLLNLLIATLLCCLPPIKQGRHWIFGSFFNPNVLSEYKSDNGQSNAEEDNLNVWTDKRKWNRCINIILKRIYGCIVLLLQMQPCPGKVIRTSSWGLKKV